MRIIILILLVCFMNSCNKDDEAFNPRNDVNQILGIWKPIKFVVECDEGSETIYNYENCNDSGLWNFKSDQNFDIGGKQFTPNGGCITFDISGQWGINADTLYLQVEDDAIQYLLYDITAAELKLGVNIYQNETCGSQTDRFTDHYVLQCVNNCL